MMIHKELLEQLNWAIQEYDRAYDNTNYYYTALRAVVELHYPLSGWEDGVEVENHHCSCDEYNEYDMGYPCDTIQAIDKELK